MSSVKTILNSFLKIFGPDIFLEMFDRSGKVFPASTGERYSLVSIKDGESRPEGISTESFAAAQQSGDVNRIKWNEFGGESFVFFDTGGTGPDRFEILGISNTHAYNFEVKPIEGVNQGAVANQLSFQIIYNNIGKIKSREKLYLSLLIAATNPKVKFVSGSPNSQYEMISQLKKSTGSYERSNIGNITPLPNNLGKNEETLKFLMFQEHVIPYFKNFFNEGIDFDAKGLTGDDLRKATTAVGSLSILLNMKTWLNSDEGHKSIFNKMHEVYKMNFGGRDYSGSAATQLRSIVNAGAEIIENPQGDLAFLIDNLLNPNINNLVNGFDSGKNPAKIFYNLGFSDDIADAAEESGVGEVDSLDPLSLAASLATSAVGTFGSHVLISNQLNSNQATSNLELSQKIQCFLTSGLLYPDGNTTLWQKYWNITGDDGASISPLSGYYGITRSEEEQNLSTLGVLESSEDLSESFLTNLFEGHNRIYPVDPSFDSRSFMNKAIVGEDTRDVFSKIASDIKKNTGQNYNQIFKQLWWVFDDPTDGGSVGLSEIQLFFSSHDIKKDAANNTAKLKTALRILNSENLSPAEKTLRVEELELKKITYTVDDKGNKTSKSEPVAPTLDGVFTALQEAQVEPIDTSADVNDYYYLEQISVDFKGTTPATARNDVTVEFKFNLSSLKALGLPMHPGSFSRKVNGKDQDYQIKLYDLITLPNTQELTKGFDSFNKDQFHPDYSRIRLKLAAKSDYTSNLIIDLNTIDYDFSRAGVDGTTTMTLNMRGYFETMLDMPENDILTNKSQRQELKNKKDAVNEAIKERNELPEEATDEVKKEKDDAIKAAKEAEKTATQTQRRDVSATVTALNEMNLIHSFTLKDTEATRNIESGNPNIDKNYVQDVALQSSKGQHFDFFFFGDILYVLMDILYKEESAELKDDLKNLNMRYIVAPIEVPKIVNGKVEYITINPLCIPISLEFFTEWYNDVVVKKNITNYRIGVFLRDLIERLVNKIIYDTCFSAQTLISPPQIRNAYISTTEKEWYRKNSSFFFDPDNPYNDAESASTFLRKSIFIDDNAEESTRGSSVNKRPLQQTNYCVIYPSYIQATKGLTQVAKVAEEDTLKRQDYTPQIFYGSRIPDFNFVSNVSLSKTNGDFLREARYSSTNYGALSLLSNVYDLSFSFQNRASNTVLFPGVILNFILVDWDYFGGESSPYKALEDNSFNYTTVFGNSNPHDGEKIAHLLGLGGYFIISQVKYILGQTSQDFEIQITCKFNGMDGSKGVRPGTEIETGPTEGDKSKGKDEKPVKPDESEETDADGDNGGDGINDEDQGNQINEDPTTFDGTENYNIAKAVTIQMETFEGSGRAAEQEYGKKLLAADTVSFTTNINTITDYSKLESTTDNSYDSSEQLSAMGVTIEALFEAQAAFAASTADSRHQSFIAEGEITRDPGSGTITEKFFMYYNSQTKVLTVRYP